MCHLHTPTDERKVVVVVISSEAERCICCHSVQSVYIQRFVLSQRKKRNGLGQCCVVKMQWQKRCHSIDVNCQTVLISVNRSKYRYDHMEALFVLIAHPMATAYEMLDQRSASVLLWLCSNVHDTCWEKCVGFGLCFKSNALSWVYGLLVIVCLKAEVSEYHLAKWWWGV